MKTVLVFNLVGKHWFSALGIKVQCFEVCPDGDAHVGGVPPNRQPCSSHGPNGASCLAEVWMGELSFMF